MINYTRVMLLVLVTILSLWFKDCIGKADCQGLCYENEVCRGFRKDRYANKAFWKQSFLFRCLPLPQNPLSI